MRARFRRRKEASLRGRYFASFFSRPWASIIDSPCFLDTYVSTLEGNPEFLETLIRAGYSPELAHSLAAFQVNGCFKAVKMYGHDEAKWREVRSAIDTFVCGGLAECSLRDSVAREHL